MKGRRKGKTHSHDQTLTTENSRITPHRYETQRKEPGQPADRAKEELVLEPASVEEDSGEEGGGEGNEEVGGADH
jgi:hypothetical protein